MKQLTEKQAIALFDSKEWENWDDEKKVRFQLFQDRLCMPFPIFHKAMESVLDRLVWTHEFAFRKQLTQEYLGGKKKPSFDEIMNLIPEDKRIVVGL